MEIRNHQNQSFHVDLSQLECCLSKAKQTPLCHYVPEKERDGFIENIQNALEVFASKKCKYKDEDVRWRHVELYEGTCILYDLAELKASTSKRFVPQHVTEFKNRANMVVPRSSNNPQAFVIKPLKEKDAQLFKYLWHTRSGTHCWYGRL
jgi:hypothetical protein